MMNHFETMEKLARVALCAPNPEGYSFDALSKPQKILHATALAFDFVDLIDVLLDIIVAFRLLWSGDRPVFGVCLLLGIAIGRTIASKGKSVLLKGGLQWAPFFQDRREFYQRVGPNTALPALFALLFTEISVFMFEDATMLSIWISTDSFDKNDTFDRLNGWFTLLSVTMCLSLLLGSVIAWLRLWRWKSDLCSVTCQLLSAIAFLAIFGIIVAFLASLVFLGFQTITGRDDSETETYFLINVCLSWSFGSFFACTLRQRSRVQTHTEGFPSNQLNNTAAAACNNEEIIDATLSDEESCSRNSDSQSHNHPTEDSPYPSSGGKIGGAAEQEEHEGGHHAVMLSTGYSYEGSGSSIRTSSPFAEAVLINDDLTVNGSSQ